MLISTLGTGIWFRSRSGSLKGGDWPLSCEGRWEQIKDGNVVVGIRRKHKNSDEQLITEDSLTKRRLLL